MIIERTHRQVRTLVSERPLEMQGTDIHANSTNEDAGPGGGQGPAGVRSTAGYRWTTRALSASSIGLLRLPRGVHRVRRAQSYAVGMVFLYRTSRGGMYEAERVPTSEELQGGMG